MGEIGGVGCCGPGFGGAIGTSTTVILVLYILLVIILRTF
ncbi:YjcZ family sporulation protein [Paenibacillus motobuensis]|nr:MULTISPECIES: YjcZ family sporulation protein [Paenibacillus]MCM3039200.1 YjcZ family sporulation protein [Paenibacillus lutimineralis]MCM3646304.1 YjcZ family sporulation protein [Paenibacillus motobuensis]